MKEKKTIYYTDSINDDFAGMNINKKTVDKNFKYIHGKIWHAISFVLYYLIAYPVVWLFERVILRVKFVNKKAVKKLRKTPYFMYGNHTGIIDAYTPNLISCPRANKIIVGPETVSIKGLVNLTQMLGAFPIPSGLGGMKNFMNGLTHYHKKYNFTIYPEAHIWPYYTGVRPFLDTSFSYPVKFNSPVIAFFTAYTKPKGFLSFLRKANVTVYVSDPIYPDQNLSFQEAKKDLRDKVYNFMLEKSAFSDYAVINYVKKEEEELSKTA